MFINELSTVYTCTCKPLICTILLISCKHICNHLSQVCPCHLITCWWKPSLSVSDGFHLETIACKEAKSCMEGKLNVYRIVSLWMYMYDHHLGRANLLPRQHHCTLYSTLLHRRFFGLKRNILPQRKIPITLES